MPFDAVLFDLFGTLVPSYPPGRFRESIDAMAAAIDVDGEKLYRWWVFERCVPGTTDIVAVVEANLREICAANRVRVDDAALRQAALIRIAFTRSALVPRHDTINVLATLRSRDLPLAVVSDCSAEVPALWPETPLASYFGAAAFSCEVGVKKPDQRMYFTACDALCVAPERCLYVGDGFSRELSGARRLDMQAVLIDARDDEREDNPTCEAGTWDGPRIKALSQILEIV